MTAQEIILKFKKDVTKYVGGEVTGKGAITGVLEKGCGGQANRYLVLKVLTDKTSSKLLTEAEWYALMLLVEPVKPVGGHWTTAKGAEELRAICGTLLTYHTAQEG